VQEEVFVLIVLEGPTMLEGMSAALHDDVIADALNLGPGLQAPPEVESWSWSRFSVERSLTLLEPPESLLMTGVYELMMCEPMVACLLLLDWSWTKRPRWLCCSVRLLTDAPESLWIN